MSISTRVVSKWRVYVHTGRFGGGPVITLLSARSLNGQCRRRGIWPHTRAPRGGGIRGGVVRTYDLTHAWNFGGVVLSVGLGKGVVGGGKIRHEVSGDVVVVVVVMSDERRWKERSGGCFDLESSCQAGQVASTNQMQSVWGSRAEAGTNPKPIIIPSSFPIGGRRIEGRGLYIVHHHHIVVALAVPVAVSVPAAVSAAMASLRLAVPRAGFSLHSRQLQHLRILPAVRHASTDKPTPPKPRVLEKPDKFRPPSHPARLRSKPRYTYGPDLTPTQRTRRYPHMMPPEGTFMHWFLTNRVIHLWISLVRDSPCTLPQIRLM